MYNKYSCRLTKRAFRAGEEFMPDFPDSIDLKITNKCEWSCPWCHESSNKNGKSFSLSRTKEILSVLPKVPIEIAIGGGNVLDIAEDTLDLVLWLKERNNQPRITINYRDVEKYWNEVDGPEYKLVKEVNHIGVSLSKAPHGITEFSDFYSSSADDGKSFDHKHWKSNFSTYVFGSGSYQTVFHVIAGLFPPKDILELRKNFKNYPILFLGYKQWGRAKDTELPIKTLQETEEIVAELMSSNMYGSYQNSSVLGFDNLALEQLHIKDKLPERVFERLYLGDEGSHSMYIDAVNEEYAVTSRSPERVSWNDVGLLDYFKNISLNGSKCNI